MPQSSQRPIEKLISGGQTGADRAALDWAIAHKIPHGGWCPKGRLSEDGPIEAKYLLTETPSEAYAERTEWNARDSDGTVTFTTSPSLTGGLLTTFQMASKHGKPFLQLRKDEIRDHAQALRNWIREKKIHVLNVAGPRLSEEPAITDFVVRVLDDALAPE